MVAAAAGSALVWFLGLLTASVSLLVGNKFVAQSYSANNLTILFQNGVAIKKTHNPASLTKLNPALFRLKSS